MLRMNLLRCAKRSSPLLLAIAFALSCMHDRTHVPSYPYRLVDSVAIGGALDDAQVLPNGKFVYVTDIWGESLTIVRTSDLQPVKRISLNQGWWGEGDVQVMCSPSSEFVYVVPYGDDYVGVVHTASQSVVDSVKLGEAIGVICSAISPDGRRLFAAVDDRLSVVVVSLLDKAIEDSITTLGESYVSSMAVSPDGSRFYVIDIGDEGRVCAISLSDNTIEWQVSEDDVSEGSGALALHPSGSPIYILDEERVSARESGKGYFVGAASLESSWRVEIAPDGLFLYVVCVGEDSGAVAVVRTSDFEVVRVIEMPTDVSDVAPSPDGQKLYVTGDNGKLYVLGR